MRKAMFAGVFYEKAVTLLDRQITECFMHEKGPGDLPGKETNDKILGAVIPHAGYAYSGPAAAWAYKAIAEAKKPDLFIILGTNHKSDRTVVTLETFDMPFGFVRVDHDFAKKLVEKGNVAVDDAAHAGEHSVEVQLPFLQFILKDQPERIKIVPILVGHDCDLKELGTDIKETLIDTKKTAIIIASSDFTHYGRNYHYVPFTIDVADNIYAMDKEAIEFIKKLDPQGFLKYCEEKFATICGASAIALLLHSINPKNVHLEQYYTSGDLAGDYKNSVSYASMLFR